MSVTVKRDKMSTHIVKQFRQAIMEGKLSSGQALPPEKELIHEFGVSKHTLREALRALESMGLIEIRRGAGGGPVVRQVDMATTRESIANFLHFKNASIKDLSEARKVLEPYLARRAAENFTSEDLVEFRAVHERCCRMYDPVRNRGVVEEINFHVFLARRTGNPVLVMMLDAINNLLADLKKHLHPDENFARMVHDGHHKIVEAILRQDGDRAEKYMREHVREVEDALLKLEEAVASGEAAHKQDQPERGENAPSPFSA